MIIVMQLIDKWLRLGFVLAVWIIIDKYLVKFGEWNSHSVFWVIWSVYFMLILYRRDTKRKSSHKLSFELNIEDLTTSLVSMWNLRLKRKVGNFYIFRTNNAILPNLEYIVGDHGDYCTLVVPRLAWHNVEMDLKVLPIKKAEEK